MPWSVPMKLFKVPISNIEIAIISPCVTYIELYYGCTSTLVDSTDFIKTDLKYSRLHRLYKDRHEQCSCSCSLNIITLYSSVKQKTFNFSKETKTLLVAADSSVALCHVCQECDF